METRRVTRTLLHAGRPFFARRDRLDESQSMSSASFARGDLSIARYRRDDPGLGVTMPNPTADMVMAVVSLRPRPGHAGWQDGHAFDVPEFRVGALTCLDLRASWTFDLWQPFDSLHAFIPLTAFDEAAPGLGMPEIGSRYRPVGDARPDEVMLGLAQSLIPLLSRPRDASTLFADHVFSAMVVHLASAHGGRPHPQAEAGRRGMLALVQERRVRERMLDTLNGDPSTAELAALCDLSRSQFTRAFRQTTGMPPHRWLLVQRVARAKELLARTALPISEVALECGFADQSHLTRVFSKACGVGPGRWRRNHQG